MFDKRESFARSCWSGAVLMLTMICFAALTAWAAFPQELESSNERNLFGDDSTSFAERPARLPSRFETPVAAVEDASELGGCAAAPEEQDVFTTFNDFPSGTAEFSVGAAEFFGDASASTLGIAELYVSFPRAWVIRPGGTGIIEFDDTVTSVSFFARARSLATETTVVTAIGDDDDISVSIVLSPENGFQLVSFCGGIERIEVVNNDPMQPSAIDDFGFTVATDDDDDDGDGGDDDDD